VGLAIIPGMVAVALLIRLRNIVGPALGMGVAAKEGCTMNKEREEGALTTQMGCGTGWRQEGAGCLRFLGLGTTQLHVSQMQTRHLIQQVTMDREYVLKGVQTMCQFHILFIRTG